MNRRLFLLLSCLAAGCGGEPAGPAPVELEGAVYTTFHPTTWMAERISGGLVPVVCPLPPGEDPIFWQPDREALERYARARLVVVIGAGLERWVATASLPPSRVVDSAAGFRGDWLEHEGATTHSHGTSGAHTHTGLDGHTWLDPVLALAQSRAILGAMRSAFPAHADAFRANHAEVDAELEVLHAELADLAPRLRAANLIASHPAYQYLARRYELEIVNLDLDPEAPLDADAIAALQAARRADAPNLLLWESEPAPETAAAVPEGIASVLVSPAENPDPAAGGFGAVMRANVARLREALE
jgi:zinc transport system substrate-binding protein